MALIELLCPSCQKVHAFDGLVPFRAECDACSADLHVCIACRMHDRYVENECREDQADPVAQKDRRNLCEYFKPQPIGADAADHAAAEAKRKLAALFGAAPSTSSAPASLPPPSGADAAAEAKRKLDELFKKK